MASDTLVGIVGAAVLVAVMVGVFAYEYNNASSSDDGGDGDTKAQRMAAFNETYPALRAEEDIDENGVPNWEEENLTLHVVKDFSGAVDARSPMQTMPNHDENTFFVGTGATGGTVTVTWDVTTAPGAGALDNLQVSIEGLQCTNGDGQATCDLTGAEMGTYTIVVEHAGPPAGAQEKSFEGTVEIHY